MKVLFPFSLLFPYSLHDTYFREKKETGAKVLAWLFEVGPNALSIAEAGFWGGGRFLQGSVSCCAADAASPDCQGVGRSLAPQRAMLVRGKIS